MYLQLISSVLRTKALLGLAVALLAALVWYVQEGRHAGDPLPHETKAPIATLNPEETVAAMKQGPIYQLPIPAETITPKTTVVPVRRHRSSVAELDAKRTVDSIRGGALY